MSSFIVGANDIDAIVSVARSWTDQGLVAGLPAPVRAALTVTNENADEIGRLLWQTNHDANNFGGPPEFVDPEDMAELAEDFQPMPEYTYRPLAGDPSFRAALHVIGFYDYQTAGDYWEDSYYWVDGRMPFAAMFSCGLRIQALVLAGLMPSSAWDALDPHSGRTIDVYAVRERCSEAETELMHRDRANGDRPEYPWGLSDADRDLFTRDGA